MPLDHRLLFQSCSSQLGMFMKILNFFVFNKMVSDRKILWFPSKWGVNHLKRWRNCEVVGKKRIMNYSQKLWPGTANWLARGCSGDLHYDQQRNLPSNPPELLCICIVRVYTESYVDSQNSLFCLLTCNNDHKSLYMPILWYVIISPNST